MQSEIVRKHPAPEGALRLNLQECRDIAHNVRKHPAPEGALRPFSHPGPVLSNPGQKAPSTRRCIATYISACAGTSHADFYPCPPESRYPALQSLFTFPPLKGRNDASSPAITTTIVNGTTIPTPPAPSSPSFRLRETGPAPRGGHSPAPARGGLYVV